MSITLDVQSATAMTTPTQQDFQRWIEATLRDRSEPIALCIRLVDEDESQSLNHEFRGKNQPTNVLSFPFAAPEQVPATAYDHLLGDLILCAPLVQQEASQQDKAEQHHWAHLTVHGTLHLLGYDHEEPKQAQEMEQMERSILASLNIPDPYQEATAGLQLL